MKNLPLQEHGRADLLVGPDARQRDPTWFRLRLRGRIFVRALQELRLTLITWLAPNPRWRRYRVLPRTNPAAFRHDLLRGIELELRRSGLVVSRPVPEHATH